MHALMPCVHAADVPCTMMVHEQSTLLVFDVCTDARSAGPKRAAHAFLCRWDARWAWAGASHGCRLTRN